MGSKFHRQAQARAMALLRSSGRMSDVTPCEPDPTVEAIGARAGLGYSWSGSSATAAVYEFDSYGQAREAEDRLAESADGPRGIRTSVNGALLLLAAADADDLDAKKVVRALASAFAGRE